MSHAPRSIHFDDVYFSAEDGLAETTHVFLQGNKLPQAWAGRDDFMIAETGFGTGLNFLAVASLFLKTSKPDQSLTFYSVEKYPVDKGLIREALSPWESSFQPVITDFLKVYSPEKELNETFYNKITIRTVYKNVRDALAEEHFAADCWFLDGFKPATNTDMWSAEVLDHVGRLTRPGGSFATFTVAGSVRRNLQAAGFEISKRPGFGRKRDMLTGVKL